MFLMSRRYDSCQNDMNDFLRSMCLAGTQFEQENELQRKRKLQKSELESESL